MSRPSAQSSLQKKGVPGRLSCNHIETLELTHFLILFSNSTDYQGRFPKLGI